MMNSIEAGSARKLKIFHGWFIVAACFFLLLCYAGTGFYSFGVFIKPLEAEFGCSRSKIALTISIYLMVNGMFAPVLGRLTQTIGPKKIIIFGTLASSLCLLMISFAPNLLIFQALYALLAVCITGIGYIPVSTLVANWFQKRKGTATGLAYMGMSAGGMILVPLIGRMNQAIGWRHSFIFLSLFVLVIALPPALLVIKETPGPKKSDKDESALKQKTKQNRCHEPNSVTPEQPLGKILSSRSFIWLFLTFFAGAMPMVGMLQHQVSIMSGKGISYITASTAMGITAFMGGMGKLFFGWLTEFLKLKRVVLLCFGFQATGVLILIFLKSELLIWAYTVFYGLGMGGVLVLQALAVGQYFGPKSFSMMVGVFSFIQLFGGACGAFGAGLLFDHFGDYRFTMLLFVSLYTTSIFSIFMTGEPNPDITKDLDYPGKTGPQ